MQPQSKLVGLLATTAGLLLPGTLARTVLSGCTSTTSTVNGQPSIVWYVPGTGEICSLLNCGGVHGRPITTKPGCDLYQGTATVTPSYLSGHGTASGATGSDTTASVTESADTTATPGGPLESVTSVTDTTATPGGPLESVTSVTDTKTATATNGEGTVTGTGASLGVSVQPGGPIKTSGTGSTAGSASATETASTSKTTGTASGTAAATTGSGSASATAASSTLSGAAAPTQAGFLGVAAAMGAGLALL